MPYFAKKIVELAASQPKSNEDLVDRESLDDELHWLLHIVSRVVRRAGSDLLDYQPEITAILSAVLPLASTKASSLGGKLLRHTLKALLDCYSTSLTKHDGQLVDRTPSAWLSFYVLNAPLLSRIYIPNFPL